MRINDFHKDAQQQSHTLAYGLEMSAGAEDALIPNSFGTVSRRAGAETNALSEEAEYRAALSRQGRDVSMVAGSRSKVARKPVPKKPTPKRPVTKKPTPRARPKKPTPVSSRSKVARKPNQILEILTDFFFKPRDEMRTSRLNRKERL